MVNEVSGQSDDFLNSVCMLATTNSQRDIDDIVTLWSWLDEKLQTRHLSVYVSDDPDTMSSTRLYEGDMRGIMECWRVWRIKWIQRWQRWYQPSLVSQSTVYAHHRPV